MTDITEGTQTIIGLLKDSSTGIGTSGYEITDDDSTGLTISNGDILVTATMSKDELKDQFGGDQDYDVIIVVKIEEVEDKWIGLSSKNWIENVIIEVNVIDKWSAVDTKFITGDLVRAKTVNALRKYIKAKTNYPGGTITKWELERIEYEEDTTTKPTMWKGIMRTNAYMYYNPEAVTCLTGERVSNGGLENGDFAGWINDRWEVTDTNYGQTGTYCAKSTIVNSVLKQNFNILLSCFTANSTFTVDVRAEGNVCLGTEDEVTITLVFDSDYTKDIVVSSTSNWDTQNLLTTLLNEISLGNVSTTNRLVQVKFTVTDDSGNGYVLIDEFTLVADGT